MDGTAEKIANAMTDALGVKYPNTWVVLLMDTVTGAADVVEYGRTEQGRRDAEDFLMLSALFLPVDILVFTNMHPA